MTVHIQPIHALTAEALQPLLASSLAEGYDFIQKLWDEYQSGVNRFDTPGAVLLGGYEAQGMAAVGGITIDPYLNEPTIGRVRHVYVLPALRRAGVGGQLMHGLIDHARAHFHTLTLRTPTAHGDAFYQSLGFQTAPRFAQATHWLDINA